MSWVSTWKSIRDKLESKLKALTIDGTPAFQAVYIGRKSAPTVFPCAFIFPNRVRTRVAAAGSSQFEMPFEIRVVSKDPSIKGGADDAVTRLGAVEQMLISDRKFEGTVLNLEVDEIEPESIRPRVSERPEANLTVRFITII